MSERPRSLGGRRWNANRLIHTYFDVDLRCSLEYSNYKAEPLINGYTSLSGEMRSPLSLI